MFHRHLLEKFLKLPGCNYDSLWWTLEVTYVTSAASQGALLGHSGINNDSSFGGIIWFEGTQMWLFVHLSMFCLMFGWLVVFTSAGGVPPRFYRSPEWTHQAQVFRVFHIFSSLCSRGLDEGCSVGCNLNSKALCLNLKYWSFSYIRAMGLLFDGPEAQNTKHISQHITFYFSQNTTMAIFFFPKHDTTLQHLQNAIVYSLLRKCCCFLTLKATVLFAYLQQQISFALTKVHKYTYQVLVALQKP